MRGEHLIQFAVEVDWHTKILPFSKGGLYWDIPCGHQEKRSQCIFAGGSSPAARKTKLLR